MLPQRNRIRKNADFGLICRQGKTLFCGKLVLKVRRNDLEIVRLGISVGIGYSPKAVVRNQAKRQIRGFFSRNLQKIQPSWDIIVIVQKGWGEGGYSLSELEKCLDKGGLINNISLTTNIK
ncbi:MAG: ribonuclease P protein component [Candidatus Moraniibacteriota bacterium]